MAEDIVLGVLRPAFRLAYEDDFIRKNPFDFELASVLVNDSVTRQALTRKQERLFLEFDWTDPRKRHYADSRRNAGHLGAERRCSRSENR